MNQYLPYGGFKCLNQNEIDKFDVNTIGENISIGQILEVDLEYLDELHEMHNDYPLASEKLKVSQIILTNNCTNIANDYRIKIGSAN